MQSKYEVITVAIHASPKTRFQRLLSRKRSDDPNTWEVFFERDSRELDVGLGDVIALADLVLINEGTIADLQAQFKREISRIGLA
jgi:dephospho-CoA kinase